MLSGHSLESGPQSQSERTNGQIIRQIEATMVSREEFWVGTDVTVLNPQSVYPHQTVSLKTFVSDEALPPLSDEELAFVGSFGSINATIRSRYAQAGVQSLGFRVERVNGNRVATFDVVGLGGRPVNIPAGGFARFYSPAGAEMLTGSELARVIAQGEVGIGGTFGQDWGWAVLNDNGISLDSDLVSQAVAIALKMDGRYSIPSGEEPITPDMPNYRPYLDSVALRLLADDEHASFWVSETRSRVTLVDKFNGILCPFAKIGEVCWVVQNQSWLLQGGLTDWPIRTELSMPDNQHGKSLVPTAADYQNQWAILHIFRNK